MGRKKKPRVFWHFSGDNNCRCVAVAAADSVRTQKRAFIIAIRFGAYKNGAKKPTAVKKYVFQIYYYYTILMRVSHNACAIIILFADSDLPKKYVSRCECGEQTEKMKISIINKNAQLGRSVTTLLSRRAKSNFPV